MSIFEDLPLVDFQGGRYAVLDRAELEGPCLGLAPVERLEAAARALAQGQPPDFPRDLVWARQGPEGLLPLRAAELERLLDLRRRSAQQAFRKP